MSARECGLALPPQGFMDTLVFYDTLTMIIPFIDSMYHKDIMPIFLGLPQVRDHAGPSAQSGLGVLDPHRQIILL